VEDSKYLPERGVKEKRSSRYVKRLEEGEGEAHQQGTVSWRGGGRALEGKHLSTPCTKSNLNVCQKAKRKTIRMRGG